MNHWERDLTSQTASPDSMQNAASRLADLRVSAWELCLRAGKIGDSLVGGRPEAGNSAGTKAVPNALVASMHDDLNGAHTMLSQLSDELSRIERALFG